jgi:hypothetical protein
VPVLAVAPQHRTVWRPPREQSADDQIRRVLQFEASRLHVDHDISTIIHTKFGKHNQSMGFERTQALVRSPDAVPEW